MNRKRAIALGAATLAVALGTGTVVQRLAPTDHPAFARDAGRDARLALSADAPPLPEIADAAITPLAAEVGLPDLTPAPAGPLHAGGGPGVPSQVLTGGLAADLAGTFLPGLADGIAAETRRAVQLLPRLAELSEATAEPEEDLATPGAATADVGTILAADAPDAGQAPPGDCSPRLSLIAVPPAMIDLAFDAPCHPMARVVVRHAGLAVTGRTSPTGALDLSLPAFEAAGEVTVAVTGGPSATAAAEVTDLAGYDRVAVQWQNADAFQLHAYEFGAGFGAPGHVSAANPGGPDRALGGVGGFLTLAGDSRTEWPLLAEIYTFPAGRIARSGAVELVLEAAITAETCGRELLGETLEMRRGGAVARSELDVSMPGCDAVGDFVLLRDLFGDLVLARN